MKINFLIILLFITSNTLLAQPIHRLTLPPVDSIGYYSIHLSAGVLGRAAKDFADLRIMCDEKEIPYFIQTGGSYDIVNEYIPYKFSITKKGKKSELLIEVGNKKISTFDIEIKNSAFIKNYSLNGSNDMKEWYGLSKGSLSGGNNSRLTSEIRQIDFPLSDYRYYKMVLNDSLSEPLNILKVGAEISENIFNLYETEIPQQNSKIITEKEKESELFLKFPHKYNLSRIHFFVSSPTFFSRDCDFGTISNDKQSVTCKLTTDTLRMTIYNGDDQPLTIDSIKCYTPSVSLIAHLDRTKNYILTFGDDSASTPVYDLSFKKHIPSKITTITTDDSAITTTLHEKTKNNLTELLWKYGIWVVIALVILQILLIVKRKLKEIR